MKVIHVHMADLSSLGLSEVEEKVYKALLVSGQLNRGEIAVTSKVGMNDVQSALDSLIGKKLVREIPGLQGRYAYLLPLGSVKTELEASVNQIGSLGKELNQASSDTISQIKGNIESANQSIKEKVDATSEDINKKFVSMKESLNTTNSAYQDTSNEKIDSYSGSSLSKIDNHSSSLSASLENLKTESGNVITQAKSVIPTERIADFTEQKTSANSNLDDVGVKYDTSIVDLEISMTKTVSEIEEASNKSMADLDSLAFQYDEDNKSAGTELTTDLTNQSNDMKVKVEEAKTSTNDSKDSVNLHLETFSSNFTAKSEKGTQDMENLQNQFIGFIDDTQLKLSDAGKNMHAEVSHLIQSVDGTYSGTIKDLKTDMEGQITTDFDTLEASFDMQFKKIMEDVKVKLSEFKIKLNQNVDAKIDEINTKKNSMKVELESNVKSSSDNFGTETLASTTTQRQSGQELFGTIQSNFSDFNNTASEMVKNITSELQNLSVSVSGYLDGINTALDQSNTANAAKVQAQQEKISSNYNKLVKEQFATQKASLSQNVSKMTEMVDMQINDSKLKMTELISSMKNQMDAKITELESSFANIQDVISQNAESAVNDIQQKYLDTFSTEYEKASGLNSSNRSEMESLISDLKNLVNDTSNTLAHNFNSQLSNMHSALTSNIDGFQDENIKSSSANSTAILDQIAKVSQEGGESTVKLISQTVDTYKAKFEESSSLIVEKTLALTQVVDNLFKYQESAETPTLNTTHIIGKEAIVHQMKDLIDRVKSKVTILVPDKKMVDIDQIAEMKSAIQVTIISHIDEVADKDWIDKLHDCTANVTLRSIQKSVGGGELPDFIGCEREGEEILLGTVDDAKKDYVAIASNSEYFVQILGNIVIADYARGKSKQIKKA